MPTIFFAKKNRAAIQVPVRSNLMKALLAAKIPVASSCNGDGVCSKCKLQVIAKSGHTNLANETEIFLREKFSLKAKERISCQTEVLGDIQVDASYW